MAWSEPGFASRGVLHFGAYDESSGHEIESRTCAQLATPGVVVHAFEQHASYAAGDVGACVHLDAGAAGRTERSDGFEMLAVMSSLRTTFRSCSIMT